MIDKNLLYSIGLTDNEIQIYELLLTLGMLGIREITKKSKLQRGSAYHVLYSLKDKGLIEEMEFRGKKTFLSKSPIELENIYDKKIKALELKRLELKQNLPDAVSDFLLTTKTPLISSFKGLEGLAKIYEHVLRVRKPLLIFVSHFDRVKPEFSKLINEQIKKQSRKNIHARALSTIKEYSQEYWKFAKKHGIEIRVPQNRADLPAQILIYGDNVAYTSFTGEFISTLISNPAIAESMQMIFEGLWKTAELPKIVKRSMKKKIEI